VVVGSRETERRAGRGVSCCREQCSGCREWRRETSLSPGPSTIVARATAAERRIIPNGGPTHPGGPAALGPGQSELSRQLGQVERPLLAEASPNEMSTPKRVRVSKALREDVLPEHSYPLREPPEEVVTAFYEAFGELLPTGFIGRLLWFVHLRAKLGGGGEPY
jgi:hypothetical protein